ncbi:MAG: CpaD family pilus assembly lipoprotein [Alphaproteobacteria bacterium]|nr:CpaD family pilus assembly lipoprotein [Alphaproteobacteria bacterium]
MICESRMIRKFLIISMVGGALMVSSCAETATAVVLGTGAYYAANPDKLPLEDFSNVPEARAPRADLVQYGHDVAFAAGEARLTNGQRQRLDSFLARLEAGYGDRFYVVAGRGRRGAPKQAAARLGERRRQAVMAFLELRRLRVLPLRIEFGIDAPVGEAVKVIVRRYVVTLPGCPDWTGRPGISYDNATSSNFGCATAVNFGLMVADPGDIVAGRHPGLLDGEFAARSIERYRKGETTPLKGDEASTASAEPTDGGDSGAAAPLD